MGCIKVTDLKLYSFLYLVYYQHLEGEIPVCLIYIITLFPSRRAYKKLAASPEAYFMLKSNFAVSHSLVCICQYIVGIGDRHLSNFMVDLDNGNIVGIDFGHAFGSATQVRLVPQCLAQNLNITDIMGRITCITKSSKICLNV